MHEAATAAVTCPVSRAARSSLLGTARWKSQDSRWFACVALTVRCVLSKNKTLVCGFGPDQDPRDVSTSASRGLKIECSPQGALCSAERITIRRNDPLAAPRPVSSARYHDRYPPALLARVDQSGIGAGPSKRFDRPVSGDGGVDPGALGPWHRARRPSRMGWSDG
eukprot:3456806-Prymnesium_polylepis.1